MLRTTPGTCLTCSTLHDVVPDHPYETIIIYLGINFHVIVSWLDGHRLEIGLKTMP
jgi:hypothetical protein